jgi:hypothetical protein
MLSFPYWLLTGKGKALYIYTMSKPKKKKSKKTKEPKTKLILSDEDIPEDDEAEEDEGGVYLEKEDVRLIYNALKEYKPTKEEEMLYEIWLEEFEEMLVVDYGEPFPDAN